MSVRKQDQKVSLEGKIEALSIGSIFQQTENSSLQEFIFPTFLLILNNPKIPEVLFIEKKKTGNHQLKILVILSLGAPLCRPSIEKSEQRIRVHTPRPTLFLH